MSTGLVLQDGDLLQLGPKFEGHVVLAETAGSQYLVNAAAQKSRIFSPVYQGKAREGFFQTRDNSTDV